MPTTSHMVGQISHQSMGRDPNGNLRLGGTEPNRVISETLEELESAQYQSTFKVYSDRHEHQIDVSQKEAQPSVPGLVIG